MNAINGFIVEQAGGKASDGFKDNGNSTNWVTRTGTVFLRQLQYGRKAEEFVQSQTK
jgi:hypothetical protein